jgi:uncharacterized protein
MNTTTRTTATGLYVNLPVQDLPRSIAFFSALGFAFNPQFSDDSATAMVIGENMCAMLLTHDKFRDFAPHPISDPQQRTEVVVALSLADRAQVDDLVRRAVAAGGRTFRPPQDHGFMYGHAFQDLDGHVWELFHMDLDAFERARQGA